MPGQMQDLSASPVITHGKWLIFVLGHTRGTIGFSPDTASFHRAKS